MKKCADPYSDSCEVFEVVKEAWISFQNQTVDFTERVCLTTSRSIAMQVLHKKSGCRLVTHRISSRLIPIPFQNLYKTF